MQNRIIKFRCWDDLNKVMYYDVFVRGEIWFVEKGNGNYEILGAYPMIKPMQSTGLFDKNGKEIYEGDIVFLSINDEKPQHKGIVEYLPPKFFVMDGDKSGLILTSNYHVIGNIYENPELIHKVNNKV